jgi:hypothetical protein
VINATSECASVDLDVVASDYHQQAMATVPHPETANDGSFSDLTYGLALLRKILDHLEAAMSRQATLGCKSGFGVMFFLDRRESSIHLIFLTHTTSLAFLDGLHIPPSQNLLSA